MSQKTMWMRGSTTSPGGTRSGPWHLLAADGSPWCGRMLRRLTTTLAQGHVRPPGPVCRRCLRAERSALRAEAKQARKRAKGAHRAVRPSAPSAAGATSS
jgi:hypothetical protein